MDLARLSLFTAMIGMSFATSFHVNVAESKGLYTSTNLNRFWTGTGLSPPIGEAKKYLLSEDMEMNLELIGAVPHRGLTHVRIHWLLDLVTVEINQTDPPHYNFTDLDNLLRVLQRNSLSPGFELMGSPPNLKVLAHKFREWSRFFNILIGRYIAMFGVEYVKTWRFESLNEPDLLQYNSWNLTLPDYVTYLNASAKILRKDNLQLWGPAGLFKAGKQHTRCWGLLEVCNSTSATCPISVISFHKKGDGRASQVVASSALLVDKIRTDFRNIGMLPISNDEADPLTGWWKSMSWRADVRYAAAVVQTIIGFVDLERRRDIRLVAVSNDNGFLSNSPSFWTQRSLFARMQMNDIESNQTYLFNKPVYSAMTLLSLLGNETRYLSYQPGEPGLSMITTTEGHRITVLLTLAHDTLAMKATNTRKSFPIHILIDMPPSTIKRRGLIYLLDNNVTNPAQVWRQAGSPLNPSFSLRRDIRLHGEPHKMQDVSITAAQNLVRLNFSLRVPSVILINICNCDKLSLGPVNKLRYLNITRKEIILFWKDDFIRSGRVMTYLVQYRSKGEHNFQEISYFHSFRNSFHFDGCIPLQTDRKKCKTIHNNIEGEYKIIPIDYCNQHGKPASIIVNHH